MKKFRKSISLVLFFIILSLRAEENLLSNSGFEAGKSGWHRSDQVQPGKGRENSAAMVYQRTKNNKGFRIVSQNINLKPNTTYNFGGWIKTDGPLESVKKPAGLLIALQRFSIKNGKYAGAAQTKTLQNAPEWMELKQSYRTPADAGLYRYELIFYFEKGTYGTARFDDLYVKPKRKIQASMLRDQNDPANLVLNPGFGFGTLEWREAAAIDPKGGRNSGPALLYQRAEGDKSFRVIRQGFSLKPNTLYDFGGWVKILNASVKDKKDIRITMEARRVPDRQYWGMTISQPNSKSSAGYEQFTGRLQTYPADEAEYVYEIVIYLRKGKFGSVCFDDLYLKEVPGSSRPACAAALLYPKFNRFPTAGTKAIMAFSSRVPDGTRCRYTLSDAENRPAANGTVKITGGRAQLKFPRLSAGNYKLHTKLFVPGKDKKT
jgi:hypothetical protein